MPITGFTADDRTFVSASDSTVYAWRMDPYTLNPIHLQTETDVEPDEELKPLESQTGHINHLVCTKTSGMNVVLVGVSRVDACVVIRIESSESPIMTLIYTVLTGNESSIGINVTGSGLIMDEENNRPTDRSVWGLDIHRDVPNIIAYGCNGHNATVLRMVLPSDVDSSSSSRGLLNKAEGSSPVIGRFPAAGNVPCVSFSPGNGSLLAVGSIGDELTVRDMKDKFRATIDTYGMVWKVYWVDRREIVHARIEKRDVCLSSPIDSCEMSEDISPEELSEVYDHVIVYSTCQMNVHLSIGLIDLVSKKKYQLSETRDESTITRIPLINMLPGGLIVVPIAWASLSLWRLKFDPGQWTYRIHKVTVLTLQNPSRRLGGSLCSREDEYMYSLFDGHDGCPPHKMGTEDKYCLEKAIDDDESEASDVNGSSIGRQIRTRMPREWRCDVRLRYCIGEDPIEKPAVHRCREHQSRVCFQNISVTSRSAIEPNSAVISTMDAPHRRIDRWMVWNLMSLVENDDRSSSESSTGRVMKEEF